MRFRQFGAVNLRVFKNFGRAGGGVFPGTYRQPGTTCKAPLLIHSSRKTPINLGQKLLLQQQNVRKTKTLIIPFSMPLPRGLSLWSIRKECKLSNIAGTQLFHLSIELNSHDTWYMQLMLFLRGEILG